MGTEPTTFHSFGGERPTWQHSKHNCSFFVSRLTLSVIIISLNENVVMKCAVVNSMGRVCFSRLTISWRRGWLFCEWVLTVHSSGLWFSLISAWIFNRDKSNRSAWQAIVARFLAVYVAVVLFRFSDTGHVQTDWLFSFRIVWNRLFDTLIKKTSCLLTLSQRRLYSGEVGYPVIWRTPCSGTVRVCFKRIVCYSHLPWKPKDENHCPTPNRVFQGRAFQNCDWPYKRTCFQRSFVTILKVRKNSRRMSAYQQPCLNNGDFVHAISHFLSINSPIFQ